MKCDRCNGLGAYKVKPERPIEDGKPPAVLHPPIKDMIRMCEECKGTGIKPLSD